MGSPVYDSHGNTTTLGNQTLAYDGADRHRSTSVSGGPTVTYVRDATDRIISRTEATTTVNYGFSGPGDSSGFTLDNATPKQVVERTMGLVGGAMVTKRTIGDVWSYPNVHGDVMATANAAGIKQGATLTYDPFGQASGPVDNSAGNYDYGWLGQHQRGLEHAGTIATIEMGARPYVPALGRFLEVDPIEGGCANDYVYVFGDPVNGNDLTGTQTSPPNSNQSHRCSGIKGKIQNLRNSLSRQKQNFRLNAKRWSLDHPETLKHQATFRREQRALRGRLGEWDDNDCDDSGVGGLPSGVWSFATMATPVPNQNPSNIGPSLASRVGNWVDNFFSNANGRDAYTK